MKIKRLEIRDFGIIKNEDVNNIHSNIVVVGGLNRAGKSTLMKALRHIFYGFKRGKEYELPRGDREYYIKAKIDEDNQEYEVQLRGYSEPEISKDSKSKFIQSDDLTKGMDLYTYKNIFTISLDELKKERTMDDNKLKPILLGSGFKSLMSINNSIKVMSKRAESIGGTHGKSDVGKFKEYTKRIRGLEKEKKAALMQRDEYVTYTEKLSTIGGEIVKTENNINALNKKIKEVMFIKENYMDYKEVCTYDFDVNKEYFMKYKRYENKELLGEELRREYEEISERYKEITNNIKLNITPKVEDTKIYIEYRDKINNTYENISLLKKEINNLNNIKDEYNSKREKASSDLKNINSNFTNIEEISKINFDKQNEEILKNSCNKFKEKNIEIQNKSKNIYDIESKLDSIKENRVAIEDDFIKGINSYTISIIVIITLGIIISFFRDYLGITIIIGGCISLGVFQYIKFFNNKKSKVALKELRNQLRNMETTKNAYLKEKNESIQEIGDIESQIDIFRDLYKVDYETPLEYLIECFYRLKGVDETYKELKVYEERIRLMESSISGEIILILNIIKDINSKIERAKNIKESSNDEIISEFSKIYSEYKVIEEFAKELNNLIDIGNKIRSAYKIDYKINEYIEFLDEAVNISKTYRNKNDMRIKIETIQARLESTFEKLKENGSIEEDLEYEQVFSKYVSFEEVIREQEDLQEQLDELKRAKDSLIENKIKLQEKLSRLYEEDKIKNIIKSINYERNDLEVLAKEYAVNRISQHILQNVVKRVMENTKKSTESQWSKILKNMTNGDVQEINIEMNDGEIEYKLVGKNDQDGLDIDMLSRGTAEQLFLSARLQRLRSMEANLPVIFDDAFVNFDNNHVRSVVKEIVDISKQKQVFIFTCHNEVLEIIKEEVEEAQWLHIESGKIKEITYEQMYEYLA